MVSSFQVEALLRAAGIDITRHREKSQAEIEVALKRNFIVSPSSFAASAPGSLHSARFGGVGGSLAGQAADLFCFLDHFVHGEALFSKRAGGTGLHALTAGGAVVRVAPIVLEIADNARIDAARRDLPDM